MSVTAFGQLPDGRRVQRIALGRPPGPILHLLDLGATVQRLDITDGQGQRRNVVLGHATPQEYLDSTAYFGATVGRYANRIANGRFLLDSTTITLDTNDRGQHLHGGVDGFDRRLWTIEQADEHEAVLSLVSPDGDQGYPGRLRVTAAFRVDRDAVRIDFTATTDAPTIVNLTNHTYFNLAGEGSVDDHLLTVAADAYIPVDAVGIPTGQVADVAGTPFDLRRPTRLGDAARSDDEQVRGAGGIDHNLVLRGDSEPAAAVLMAPATGIQLALFTGQPGLQVYTGNKLDGTLRSAAGRLLRQGDGIALEPQRFPDTPNRPEFGSARLDPGETYRAFLEWRFTGG